ncbi:MAG: NAD(P)H-quinone oxidoreductase [Bacteroidetes bacterium]|nr:MAG: NAD(P)H-quinone oxidoreductase [Bacteroidota bacterium]
MMAVQIQGDGGSEGLYLGAYPRPEPGPYEVLVAVAATAVNRADILQRQGKYPPPPGASPILGLEMAGRVVATGSMARRWTIGDRVCGLLDGGGYAAYAVIHEDLALPIPEGMSLPEAAALPEVYMTAYQALFWLADLQAGERVLIHAGASGVGTAAIQLARLKGAEVWVTASAGKHEACQALGASRTIDYRSQDFAEVVKEATDGKGVPVILDFLAAPYFQQNLASLALDGRLVMLALMGGIKTEVNLAPILLKRLRVMGSTLRNRELPYKIALAEALREFAWPALSRGQIRPVIDRMMPIAQVTEAHRLLETNATTGKVVLTM